jgi:DNA topoisomerase IA
MARFKKLGASAKQQAHEAVIIDINESMISAVVVYEQQRVNLYTLFPSQGVAFMSTHKNIPLQGGIPSGALFKLECKFEFN